MEMGRIRAVKHRAAQVRETETRWRRGRKEEEEKELRSTYWKPPRRRWKVTDASRRVSAARTRRMVGPRPPGTFPKDTASIYPSQHDYLCDYLDMTSAKKKPLVVLFCLLMHTHSLGL